MSFAMDPGAPDAARISADVDRLVNSGVMTPEQARAAATAQDRQRRELASARGEHRLDVIDADAQMAADLNRKVFEPDVGERYSFAIEADDISPEAAADAEAATAAAHSAARAIGLTDGTASELIRIVQTGLRTAHAAGEDAARISHGKARAQFYERFGDEADSLVRDARAVLRRAAPEAANWIEHALDASGAIFDPWVTPMLARRYRALKG